MKRNGWSGWVVVLIAALVWMGMPAATAVAGSGDDSIGAGITVGLMVAVVVVYGLVSLRSDVELYSEGQPDEVIVRAAQMAEESPVVFQTISAPMSLNGLGAEPETEVAGAGVGWRVHF